MGLFGKLKQNMNHGGVKVHIQAPSSVPGNQVIPVTVTITADSSQTINSVKAEIRAEAKEQGVNIGGPNGGVGMQSSRSMPQTIAQVENREPFTIAPGETKTINLELYISGSAASGNPMSQVANIGGGLGTALQAVAAVAQNFDHVSYLYTVHASADVPGVSLDPGDHQPIQILPPTAAAPQPTQPASSAPVQSQPQTTLPTPSLPGMPAPVQQAQSPEPSSNQP